MWQAALEWRSQVSEGAVSFPTDEDAPERDATFAAIQTMLHRQHLPATRRRLQGIILELCKGCAPLTAALRMHQPEHAAGLQQLNLGAIVMLTMIMGWPDWQLAWHHTVGFDIIGAMPRSHVLKPADGRETEGPGTRRK